MPAKGFEDNRNPNRNRRESDYDRVQQNRFSDRQPSEREEGDRNFGSSWEWERQVDWRERRFDDDGEKGYHGFSSRRASREGVPPDHLLDAAQKAIGGPTSAFKKKCVSA